MGVLYSSSSSSSSSTLNLLGELVGKTSTEVDRRTGEKGEIRAAAAARRRHGGGETPPPPPTWRTVACSSRAVAAAAVAAGFHATGVESGNSYKSGKGSTR